MSSSVCEFYRDSVVLVTGGTGFVGKVLLAKLLTECPVKKVFLLLRPKEGKTTNERVQELFKNKAFERLRIVNPDAMLKVEAVSGDLALANLGLSAEDHRKLVTEVQVIFHAGASFEPDLKETFYHALQSNLQGTERVVKLAKKMSKLQAFIHVSTITAHADKLEIEEKIYSPPPTGKEILENMGSFTEEEINKMAKEVIGSRPNGYSVSKALSENVVATLTPKVPTAIVRPFIVGCSWEDPFPGWVDSAFGPATLVSSYGQGMLRVANLDPHCVADIIPVDYLANLMVAAAWYLHCHKPSECIVLHSSTQKRNPLTWGSFRKSLHKHVTNTVPYTNAIFYPFGLFIPSTKMHRVGDFLLHYLPATVIDIALRLLKKKPKMRTIHSTLGAAGDALSYATTVTRQVDVTTTESVWGHLKEEDKLLFPFEVRNIVWDEYIQRYALGVRSYLLNQAEDTIADSKRRMKKLYYLHVGLHTVLGVLILAGLLLPLWIFLLL